ncbi:MAG: phosphoglycerate dehydrogenase [Gammaproteobacteria bacterium]|nr:phosphoglycerate dehydrogenase [Gammaproteobacteria bacterium]MBT8133123.1 phosphoglycerate dehydrogenase [Gammaproteobacteria bacterium]NNJ48843.1 phosphoglycerate dehydrogenase [Gammaproteobacteria bacterium]
MFNIKTINNISDKGLSRLPAETYAVSPETDNPDAIILRSQKLHDMEIPSNLKVVGRAGAGTNNVPVERLGEQGIVVFNAPGANANAVKELVICGMLLACRNICQAWQYAANVEGTDEEQNKAVEAGKKKYVGYELPGRTLGVVGLGAIGVEIANAAVALGMRVVGFDPTITVKSAWKMSSAVEEMASIEELLKEADFVTFHVPLIDATMNLLNEDRIAGMKDGAVILNFARNGVVDDDAALAGIESGKINAYVCDFPAQKLKNHDRVITLPHLGASTVEAEENCAMMIADQIKDFLENGNIKNSVNFPAVKLPRGGKSRVAITHKNMPDMIARISTAVGDAGFNIFHMRNESRADLAYTLMDIESEIGDDLIQKFAAIDGVLKARQV